MKFVSGIVLGMMLCVGTWTLSAQNEAAKHPRIEAAIRAIKEARAELDAAPDDFGGHKADAIKACDSAIRQLQLALDYRARKDRH
jgi:hypothetical protein